MSKTLNAPAPQDGLSRLMEHNPLGMGVVALIAGAVVGLLIPETDQERELMGPTRDQLVDKAHDTAKDLRSKVGAVAGAAQVAAQDAVHTVKDSASEALSSVKDAVTEEVKHQGLVAEQQ